MTSPSETIAKAMEGDMSAPLNAVDRLRMLAGGVNTHNLDMGDAEWILDALNTLLPLALQLEAMKREMAEKDERIAELRAMIRDNGTPRFNAVCERAEKAERENEELRGVMKECHSALKMLVSPGIIQGTTVIGAFAAATAAERRARTLIQGEKQ